MPDVPQPATDEANPHGGTQHVLPAATSGLSPVRRGLAGVQLALLLIGLGIGLAMLIGLITVGMVAGVREVFG
jgi:hypothetical protein